MRLARALTLGAALLALGLVSTGCSQSASGMAIMDTAASVVAPPAALLNNENLVDESIRSLGEFDGLQYFVAKGAESDGYCLVEYAQGDEGGSSSCGGSGAGHITGLKTVRSHVALAQDGHDLSAGGKEPWVKLTENLWKRGS